MEDAVERDPDNSDYHYGLALARAATGLDPRPEARTALRLNSLDSGTRDAVKRFGTSSPRIWKRRVRPLIELAFE
jgi:hypothetical protein